MNHHPTAFAVFGGATVDHAAATNAPPVLHASNPGTARMEPGGVGLNVARVLARLGRPVRMVTSVGRDADGETVLAAARADGVDLGWTEISPTARTATYRAAFDHAGDLIIGIADMDIFDSLTPAVVAPAVDAAHPAEAFVMDANLPAATLAFLAEAANGRAVAAIGVSPAKAVKLGSLLARLTYLFVTRREATALLGGADDPALPTRELAAGLAGRGAGHVVVTDSDKPLAAAAGGEVHLFPPFPARVRSVNGAGDALCAGLLHGIAGDRGFFDAVLSGLAAAAITVEAPGTVAATLDADSLEARLAKARAVM
jgi:pseudouridine kinase